VADPWLRLVSMAFSSGEASFDAALDSFA